MINGTNAEALRGGPSSVQKKKKKSRKGKKKTTVHDGSDSDSSDGSDGLLYFTTGGGSSSAIASQIRVKKSTARSSEHAQSSAPLAHELTAFQDGLISNPIEIVVRDVLLSTKGDFAAPLIRDCVSRMFDSGMPYDKTEAVVKQLQHERGDITKEDPKPATSQARQPAAVIAASDAPAAPLAKITSMKAASSNATKVLKANPLMSYDRPGANDSTGVHALPMGNKLEVAARHEPLSAGLEALCSWAHIIGTDKAPEQFFAPDCRAIEIIMLALINDPNVLVNDVRTRDNFSTLLQKMFAVRSVPSSSRLMLNLIAEIEAVLHRVQAARVASNMRLLVANGAAVQLLANNLGALLRRLSVSIHPPAEVEGDIKKSDEELVAEAVVALEKEIKLLVSRAPRPSADQAKDKSPGMLKQLFAARDAHHEIFGLRQQIADLSKVRDSKSSGMVVLSMARQASAAQRPAAKTISAEELANEILADVGESTTTLSMKKSQAAAAQSALLSTGSSVSQSASKLNEIKICDDKISDFLIQKSALEHQLNALEREISIVTSRRDVLRNEYVSVSSQQHDKMSRLAAAKAESERTELLDATVRSVTATYSSLDRSIRGIEDELSAIALSCNSSGTYISSAVKTDNSQTDVSTSREAFATYVFSEVACIVALTGRVADLRNKQVQKNKEILEYERIGIPALVEELRKDQDKLSSDTVEDVKTIRALQECLVDVIKSTLTPADLAAADKDGPASFWTSSRNAVGEVKEVLRTANLPLHPVLDKFGSNKSVVPAPKAPVNTIAASTPSSSAPLSIVKSPAKPKSAWAATDIAAAADMPAHLPAVATKTVETKTLIAQPPAAEVATKEAPLPKRNPRSARDMKKDVAKNEDAADSTHDSSL